MVDLCVIIFLFEMNCGNLQLIKDKKMRERERGWIKRLKGKKEMIIVNNK